MPTRDPDDPRFSDASELGDDDLQSIHPDPNAPGGVLPFDPELAEAMDTPLGSDDDALKQIGKRSSTTSKLVVGILVVGLVALGGWFFMRSQDIASVEQRFAEIDAMEDPAQVPAALRELYPDVSAPDQKERILLNLGHLQDTDAVPLMIEALDEGGVVRRAAARALARIGLPAASPAKPKLLEVLPDTTVTDRAQVVWALAVLRERQAADALLEQFTAGMLQDLEGFDAKVIAETVGLTRLSSDELLQHEEIAIRTLTANALAELATPDTVDPLARLVRAELARGEDKSPVVIEAAVAGLGRTGDPRAAGPLFEVLDKEPALRSRVLRSLEQSVAAPGIAVLLDEASTDDMRLDLVKLLADTNDPRAADALARELARDEPRIRKAAALGLAELGDRRATPVLVELAMAEDDDVAQDALVGLRRLGDPEAVDGLLEVLDEWPGRKSATLRALGTTGVASVSRALEADLDGDDVRSAALALADLDSDSGFKKLVKMLPRPRDVDMSEPEVKNEELFSDRKAAVEALGAYGRPGVADDLRTIIEDPLDDARLRALAAASLGLVATPETMREVIAYVQQPDIEEDVRRYYVQALWQRPAPELEPALLDLVADPVAPDDVRRAAALALGYAGNPENDARLGALLESPDTQREAAFAVALGGDDENARALLDLLIADADLADLLQYVFLNEENDWFNVLTEPMFESGQIYRRFRVARILRDGKGDDRFGFAMVKALGALKSGWEGAGGVPPREVRSRLYAALTGDDPERRRLAADMLGEMGERGLLLRGRDEEGAGAEEARAVLQRLGDPEL